MDQIPSLNLQTSVPPGSSTVFLDPVDTQVNEIGIAAIRLGAQILMTVVAGAVASCGFWYGVAVIVTGLFGTLLIYHDAKTTFLEMNSPLSAIEKTQKVALAEFWGIAIFSSSMAGIGGALVYQSFVFILGATLWSVIKGLGTSISAGYLLNMAYSSYTTNDSFAIDSSDFTKRMNLLHNYLIQAHNNNKPVPEKLASFLFENYTHPKEGKELIDQIDHHWVNNHFSLEDYFEYLTPLMDATDKAEFVKKFPVAKNWTVA